MPAVAGTVLGAAVGPAGEVTTALTTTLPSAATCRLVGVPGIATAVELVTVLSAQSIEVTVLAPASRTSSVVSEAFNASAVGRPPTWMSDCGCRVAASSAATVPSSG